MNTFDAYWQYKEAVEKIHVDDYYRLYYRGPDDAHKRIFSNKEAGIVYIKSPNDIDNLMANGYRLGEAIDINNFGDQWHIRMVKVYPIQHNDQTIGYFELYRPYVSLRLKHLKVPVMMLQLQEDLTSQLNITELEQLVLFFTMYGFSESEIMRVLEKSQKLVLTVGMIKKIIKKLKKLFHVETKRELIQRAEMLGYDKVPTSILKPTRIYL